MIVWVVVSSPTKNLLTSNLVAHLSIKRSSSLLKYVVESKHMVNPLSKGYTGYKDVNPSLLNVEPPEMIFVITTINITGL